jgi:DNA-binding response OmpR family regulator
MTSDELYKIMVVDDSPQISKALTDLLGASGYFVRAAPSGERALQILETSKFDLIITDLKMTGMTGIELAKQVQERVPGLPVVILTGYGDMDSVISALRLGVADYLKKPFSIDEVLAVVEREIIKSRGRPAKPAAVATPEEKLPRLYLFAQRDLEQIEAVLSRLRAQATAESVMLVEQAGYVIAAKGLSSSGDVEPLSNLIASSRSSSASLASLLGEVQDFSTSYMEGQRVSVYTTSLGRALYLAVIVPKGTKQGLVWLYAKEAAVEIDRIVQRATASMQTQLGHAVSPADTENMRKELADQKVENVFDRRRASTPPPPPQPRVERTPPRSNVSTISFKRDRPQPEVTTSAVEAPVEVSPVAGGISFEEALKLGLVANVAPDSSSPPPETPVESEVSGGLTPDKFEEALLKGLFSD